MHIRAVAVLAAVAMLAASGCTTNNNSEGTNTAVLTETTVADVTTMSSRETTTDDDPNAGHITLPGDFADRTIGTRGAIANVAPDSSLTDPGTVSAKTVDVYTLADAPGDGTNYQLTVTSPESLVSLSVYDPEGELIMSGGGGFVFDAKIPGEYLIIISSDSESPYELIVAGLERMLGQQARATFRAAQGTRCTRVA